MTYLEKLNNKIETEILTKKCEGNIKSSIYFICIWIATLCCAAHASSEGLCVKKDVVLYSITLKEPDPQALKDGLAIGDPAGSIPYMNEGPGRPDSPDLSKAYADYYKMIRNKIRDRLVSRYYSGLKEGEINLVFTLTSNGKLESVNIKETGSAKDPGLRDMTMRSVKEATPFPPFPKSLAAARMSFDISVSFRKD